MPRCQERHPDRRAFTLLESLVAASLIGVVVLAVVSGISAAHTVSFDGQKRILASMAADDLMLELGSLEYDQLWAYDGFDQAPGAMASLDGEAYPDTFRSLGRTVSVREVDVIEPTMGVIVRGVELTVTVRDPSVDLLTVQTFIAEPAP